MHFSVSRFVCFRFTGGSLRAWWNVIVRRPKKLFEGGGKHQLHTQTHTKVQLAEYIQTREKPYWEESFSSLFSEGHHQDLSSACRERERERERERRTYHRQTRLRVKDQEFQSRPPTTMEAEKEGTKDNGGRWVPCLSTTFTTFFSSINIYV